MKQRTKWFVAGALSTAVTLGVLGLVVAVSGLAPISARSGHWPITEALLKFSMRRAVSTQSLGIEPPPDLDDPGLILRGARHYDSGCRFCHGSPGERMPPIPAKSTPAPPRLEAPVRELSARELFWIVKHGIKFTAMPAWVAPERDDEVWAMVAFLLELRSLDAAGYRALTASEPAAHPGVPEVVERMCVRCHGVDGLGVGTDAFPRLAGQKQAYLAASLQAYARGERPSGIMEPIAARLDEEAMRQAAAWYASLAPMRPASVGAPDEARASLGARIVHHGLPQQRIPACVHCHGPAPHPRKDVYPLLAGQDAWYLVDQLELFRQGTRGGSEYAHLMYEVASDALDDEAIRAVAAYYAGLLAAESPRGRPRPRQWP